MDTHSGKETHIYLTGQDKYLDKQDFIERSIANVKE